MITKTVILSTGSYVPENIVNNSDLKQFPQGVLNLIKQKTGVEARRFADDSQCTSDLASVAAERCLAKINFPPGKLDAIILATSSPDRIQPPTATRVQSKIGATTSFAFDLNAVCSGGVFSMLMGDALIRSGAARNVLVIGAEIYSRFLDPSDFSTFPYFGDGAGAALLSLSSDPTKGIIFSILGSDGSKADIIQVPAGGSMLPYSRLKNPKDIFFKMIGREVYDFAVSKGSEIIIDILNETDIKKDDLKYVIVHQANINIIRELSKRADIGLDKFLINLDRYGNTAAASLFITLDEAYDAGKIDSGDLILLVAFGGGLSWGATLVRY